MQDAFTLADAHLTEAERRELDDRIRQQGMPFVARTIGLSRGALASALAGLDTRKGTIAQIRARLSRLTTSSEPPPKAA